MVGALLVLWIGGFQCICSYKYLWVEYGQTSEFINLHLSFPWRYWWWGYAITCYYPHPPPQEGTYGVPQLIQRQDQLDSGSNTKARGGSFGLNWQLGCCQGPVVWLRLSSVVAAAAFKGCCLAPFDMRMCVSHAYLITPSFSTTYTQLVHIRLTPI